MSFGLRKLKKKSDQQELEIKSYETDFLIVGDDLACFPYIDSLEENSDFIWISEKKISIDDYQFWQDTPLSFYRDKSNQVKNFFYKNQIWHEPGSRIKPLYELSDKELFFTGSPEQFPVLKNLSTQTIEHRSISGKVLKVNKVEGHEDLIEQFYWQIELKNGDLVKCKKLIWADNLKLFTSAYTGALSPQFKEYSYSLKPLESFYVEFSVNGVDLTEYELSQGICFLPYSMTYNYGHCIFHGRKNENQWKIGSFYLINDDEKEVTEEKILAHFKRILGRVYPELVGQLNVEKLIYSDKIFLDSNNETWPMNSLVAHMEIIGRSTSSQLGNFFTRSFLSLEA